MKLVPYDIKKISGSVYRSDNRSIIEEFIHSPYECVKIEDYSHKSAESCRASLNKSVHNFGYEDKITVTRRKDEVFLVKIINKL